jgi:hypothetical protein
MAWSTAQLREMAEEKKRQGGSNRRAAEILAAKWGLRVSSSALKCALERRGVEIDKPPSEHLPIETVISRRIAEYAQKQQHEEARKLISVRVRDDRPLAILHFGDPHLDDDGTDIGAVQDHAALVAKTDGMYAATVGDTTNNWVGRLAKLYGEQGTTAADGWRLAEWFIRSVGRKWLWIVGGNHDAWSGAGDPLKWIAAQEGALYQSSEARLALRFPNGQEIRVNCRHDFDGHSQWNPAHGPMKAITMGTRDHVAIAGHKHVSAYGALKDPESGILCHALRVASYKRYDRYAREKGLRDQNVSPCVVTVIDPRLPPTHPQLVTVWWDPHEAAAFLSWTRSRKRAA